MDVKPTKEIGLPACVGDALTSGSVAERPVGDEQLMECVLERGNLLKALKRVDQNKGAAGTDGMAVAELRPYLKKHWAEIRERLLSGEYWPQPVRRVEIPKASGGTTRRPDSGSRTPTTRSTSMTSMSPRPRLTASARAGSTGSA